MAKLSDLDAQQTLSTVTQNDASGATNSLAGETLKSMQENTAKAAEDAGKKGIGDNIKNTASKVGDAFKENGGKIVNYAKAHPKTSFAAGAALLAAGGYAIHKHNQAKEAQANLQQEGAWAQRVRAEQGMAAGRNL